MKQLARELDCIFSPSARDHNTGTRSFMSEAGARILSPTLSRPSRKNKPRRLVSLCLGVLGQHLDEIIGDLIDIIPDFPSDIKLALAAISRRRRLLTDEILIALADSSWQILDISGSDISDHGLAKVAQTCKNLKTIDISYCHKITTSGITELIQRCRSLETLRCGGCPNSQLTMRRCIGLFMPKLMTVEEDSWEELDTSIISSGAESLRWLVWPMIDKKSLETLAAECPRITVNPKPSLLRIHGAEVPDVALPNRVLDHAIVEDIDPAGWSNVWLTPKTPSPPVKAPVPGEEVELPIAEKFRLAFLERDMRLAPKRAKNARQHQRRAEREWFMSSNEGKSLAFAKQVTKYLNKS